MKAASCCSTSNNWDGLERPSYQKLIESTTVFPGRRIIVSIHHFRLYENLPSVHYTPELQNTFMKSSLKIPSFLLLLFTIAHFAFGQDPELRFAKIIGDNMVIQQGKPIKIWGWAKPEEEVAVRITQDRELGEDALRRAIEQGTRPVEKAEESEASTPVASSNFHQALRALWLVTASSATEVSSTEYRTARLEEALAFKSTV